MKTDRIWPFSAPCKRGLSFNKEGLSWSWLCRYWKRWHQSISVLNLVPYPSPCCLPLCLPETPNSWETPGLAEVWEAAQFDTVLFIWYSKFCLGSAVSVKRWWMCFHPLMGHLCQSAATKHCQYIISASTYVVQHLGCTLCCMLYLHTKADINLQRSCLPLCLWTSFSSIWR